MTRGVYERKPEHRIASGERHYNWKGGLPTCADCPKVLSSRRRVRCNSCTRRLTSREDVGYSRVHKWLVATFGRADHCESETCLRESTCFEWSLRKGCTYKKVREHFWQLCKKCHNIYDDVYEKRKL